jgi:hypothetical protein
VAAELTLDLPTMAISSLDAACYCDAADGMVDEMKRAAFFVIGLLLSFSVLGVTSARAHIGEISSSSRVSYSQAMHPQDAIQAVHAALAEHQQGMPDDCDGTCSSCCAAACSATALSEVIGAAIRFVPVTTLKFAMASPDHGRKISPPSPPPRS